MESEIFDILGFLVATDGDGVITETQIGGANLVATRIKASTASCAKDRFRERNGAALSKAREENPGGRVVLLAQKFGNC